MEHGGETLVMCPECKGEKYLKAGQNLDRCWKCDGAGMIPLKVRLYPLQPVEEVKPA